MRHLAATALEALASGTLPDAAERQAVDVKEAGRRGRGGVPYARPTAPAAAVRADG